MARYQPRHKRSSKIKKISLLIVFAFATSAFAAVLFRVFLVEVGLKAALLNQNLGPVELEVQHVGLTSLELGPLSVADGRLSFVTLEIQYGQQILRSGQIESLTLSGFHVNGDWTEAGFSFGPLDRLFEGPETQTDQAETGSIREDETPQPFLIDEVSFEDATLTLSHPDGQITIASDFHLQQEENRTAVTTTTGISGPNLSGTLRWTGTAGQIDILDVEGQGAIQLNANALRLPGLAETLDISVDWTVAAEAQVLQIDQERPATINAPLPQALAAVTPSRQSEGFVKATVTTTNSVSSLFAVKRENDGTRIEADINVEWFSPIGNGEFEYGGWIGLDIDNLPQDFLFERLSLSLDDVSLPFGTMAATIDGSGLTGPLTVAEGPIRFEGTLQDGLVHDLSFNNLSVAAETTFRLDGLSLAFDLSGFNGTLEGGVFQESFRLAQPLSVALEPVARSAQSITVVFGADGSATLAFDTGLKIDVLSLISRSRGIETPIEMAIPNLLVNGCWTAGEPGLDLDIAIDGAQFATDAVQGRNISGEISGTLDSFNGSISRLTGLRPRSGPSRSGLPFESQIEWIDQQFTADGSLNTELAVELARFDVKYDAAQSDDQIEMSAGPLVFGGQNLSPSQIYGLGLPFTPTSGEIAADVSIPLGEVQPGQDSTFYLRDLEAEFGAARFERLNAVLSFEQVWPPISHDTQSIAIGLLQAGVPFTDIRATFAIREPNLINMSDLSMAFASGRVSGTDFLIDLETGQEIVNLDVNGVDLSTVAQLSGLTDLEATGVLSGSLPVLFSANDAIIRDGVLTTDSPGYIRYRPSQRSSSTVAAEGGMQLALQAMEDFQYDSLSLTVSGSITGDLTAGLAIKGRNPDLYGGYPIDFNLNLSGELANIVQGSLTGYRVPESIRQQLMAFPSRQ